MLGERVGQIYYEVTMDTSRLIEQQRAVDRELQRTAKSMEAGGSAAERYGRRLSVIASAISALGAAMYLVAQSDKYTKLNAQLKLATDSAESFARAQTAVRQIAQESQTDLSAVGVLYARITSATKELGANQRTVGDIVSVVSLAMKVSGATAQESASAMLQLSQAFASGVLRGEEFNAVNEAAPRLMKALADGMNVPVSKLREMASEGKITSAVMATALPKALQQLQTEAQSIQTVSGAFQQLRNEITLFIGQQMEASGASKMTVSAISALAQSVSSLSNYTGTFLEVATAGAVVLAGTMAGRFAQGIARATTELMLNVEANRAVLAAEVMRQKALQTSAYEVAAKAAAERAAALVTAEAAAANLAAARAETARLEAAGLEAAAITAAKRAEVAATAQLTAAETALAAARVREAETTTAATASTVALTAAQRAQAGASALASAASRTFTTVMGALGGPVGVAVIALGALALKWGSVKTAAEEAADISEQAANRIARALSRSVEAPMRELMKVRDEAAAGMAKMDAEIGRAQKWAGKDVGMLDVSDLESKREAFRSTFLQAEKAIADMKAQQVSDLFPPEQGPMKDTGGGKKDKAAKFDGDAYLAGLKAQTLEGLAAIDAAEAEAKRKNDKLLADKQLSAEKHAEAVTLIEQAAALDRDKIYQAEFDKEIERNKKERDDRQERADEYAADAKRNADRLAELKAVADPLGSLRDEYEARLALVAEYEQRMAQVGVDATTQAEAAKAQITASYEKQRQLMAEQAFASQSEVNAVLINSLNDLNTTATQAVVGLINGTMTAQDGMRALANVVLNEAVGALVQIGVQQLKNLVIGETVQKAQMVQKAANSAMYTAAVGAQVAVNTSLAAAAAFASTAAIPIIGPALAPGAAAAAAAAAASLGAPAVAAAPVAGSRQHGGPVSAAALYRVGEAGPEMFVGDSGKHYMIPGEGGRVLPNSDFSSAGVKWTINVHEAAPGTRANIDYERRIIDIAAEKGASLAVARVDESLASNTGSTWRSLRGSSDIGPRL